MIMSSIQKAEAVRRRPGDCAGAGGPHRLPRPLHRAALRRRGGATRLGERDITDDNLAISMIDGFKLTGHRRHLPALRRHHQEEHPPTRLRGERRHRRPQLHERA